MLVLGRQGRPFSSPPPPLQFFSSFWICSTWRQKSNSPHRIFCLLTRPPATQAREKYIILSYTLDNRRRKIRFDGRRHKMWCVFKVDKHKLQVFQGKIGVAKRRMRLYMLEIYRLKEGNIALISLRRFSFSEHSILIVFSSWYRQALKIGLLSFARQFHI